MPELNLPLAKAVLDKIVSEPESHDQGNWAYKTECGTVCCIAGWTMLLSGEYEFNDSGYITDHEGYRVGHFMAGAELLGLDFEQANNLFYNMDNHGAVLLLKEFINEAESNGAHS